MSFPRSILCLLLALLLGGTPTDVWAQQTITGTVTDVGEAPLPGVNVRVVGTMRGTSTSPDGTYSIVLPADRTQLSFTSIGYRTVTLEVGDRSVVDVQMTEDVLGLDEVVVTGLATSVKRRNLANAVGTISESELVPVPAQTLERALSGKIAGLSVSQNSGAPGGGINVNLRGTSTITGSTQPLYVVDGVIVDNSDIQSGLDFVSEAATAGSDNPQGQPTNRIADLNPNDIESIEVLKGASAAAIYGAKATNGVVLITTKRGRRGETQINVSQQTGFTSILNTIGTRRFTPEEAEAFQEGGGDLVRRNGFIDYEEEIFGREGLTSETSVDLSGGDADTRYFASGLVLTEDGIVENTGYDKYSAKINVEQRFSDRLQLQLNTSFVRSTSRRSITGNENQGATTLGFAQAFTPSFVDIRPRADGTFPDGPAGANPLQTAALLKNEELLDRGIVSGRAQFSVFRTESQTLDLIAQGGADVFSLSHEVVSPPELQFEQAKDPSVRGVSVAGETTSLSRNLWLNAVHQYTTPNNINFSTTAGLQYEARDLDNVQALAEGLVPTQENIDQASSLRGFEDVLEQRERGLFVQEEVDLFGKYFLTGGLRADASSRVGDTDRLFLYPKAAASVQLAAFDFWEPLSGTVNQFKLRGAFGRTGNLPRADAKYTSLRAENVTGLGGVLVPTRRGNPDIDPETTQEIEVGLDLAFLNDRGTLEVTYYTQDITDLILENELPKSSGFATEFINAGDMRTRGVEVALDVIPVRTERVNWRTTLTFARDRSEITALDVDPFQIGGFALSLGQFQIEEGRSPTTIVGLNEAGEFTAFGNSNENFRVGLSNTLQVRDVRLGFLWDWKEGGDVINLGQFITDLAGTSEDLATPEGQARANGTSTGRYVEDGTYLKLREASLTYTVPTDALQQWFGGTVRRLGLGVGGRNLLMFSPYEGYDPEVSQFGNVAVGRAVDVLPFPSARHLYFRVDLGF
jgi:TonB-linked SusC/RagA family outer membrane protein